MFSDIEGSTQRWDAHSSQMQTAVARHEQLLMESFARHGGFVFKTLGDALCVAFPTAPQAVRAAVEAQRALAAEDFSQIGGLRVRMGLHTGHAEERNADYFGPAVNRVARIMDIGHGGQVIMSDITHELAHSDLPTDVTLVDLGLHRLKDLAEPEHVWQLKIDTLPGKFPPLRSLEAVEPGKIFRRSIIARLNSTQPRIVAIVAPAGFGKSTVATQFAKQRGRYAVCDCREVETAGHLGQRVLEALSEESPDRSAELSRRQLLFRDQEAFSGTYLQVVVESWSINPQPSVFIFENVERIDGNSEIIETLWRLLATTPEHRTVVICSRTPLRARLSRFAPPHAIAILRSNDLAFEEHEIASIFEGLDVDTTALSAVTSQSRGWPVAVLLFARFQREGRLRELLDRSSKLAFEELYEYLATEVLETLPTLLTDALVACAFIPQPGLQDVAAALAQPDIEETLRGMARDLPFVSLKPEGILEIHPLIGAVLRETYQSRRLELLGRVIQAAEAARKFVRAAALHLEAGAKRSAALDLGADNFNSTTQKYTIEYSTVLSQLDPADILRSPLLWYATVHERRFRVDPSVILEEASTLYRSLEASSTPVGRIAVAVFYSLFLSDVGRHAEGESVLRNLSEELAIPEVLTDNFHGSVVHIRAAILARMGKLVESQAQFARAAPVIADKPLSMAVAGMNRAASVERILGNLEQERRLLEESVELARQTNIPTLVARGLAEGVFQSWFSGDETRFQSLLLEFEDLVGREGIPGFQDLISVFRGRAEVEESGLETPYFRMLARLVLATSADDPETAATHARRVVETSDVYLDPAWQAIARVLAAEVGAGPRSALLNDAGAFAARVESPHLVAAIESVKRRHGDLGFLRTLIERLQRSSTLHPKPHLELSKRAILLGKRSVALSKREFEFLLALSMHRHGLQRSELMELLWPEGEDAKSRNALNVMVHRLRSRLGGADIIGIEGDRYTIPPSVVVDVWSAEESWRRLRARQDLTKVELSRLRASVACLRDCSEAATFPEWFGSFARRFAESAQQVATTLSRRALARGDIAEALNVARDMVEYDPLDETAREVLIKALIASDDRAGASRELRYYRQLLRTELDAEPSAAFLKQLESDLAAAPASS
ncbi:MAG: winged helix-turn-helix domain-containing protein [Candidatus Eremiobacteraeota bacterium]|nr:winged helix-turn-helix domain-containing protein [Candidatus Eremiobacteraeota bacterium]